MRFNGSHVPSSADIVFVVEAKKCNGNFTDKKNVHTLLTMMLKELHDVGMTNNRYAVFPVIVGLLTSATGQGRPGNGPKHRNMYGASK